MIFSPHCDKNYDTCFDFFALLFLFASMRIRKWNYKFKYGCLQHPLGLSISLFFTIFASIQERAVHSPHTYTH